ncbi:hypothetical protein M419DRAFT_121161, partial [Trichoderma reesei RUT C-30]
MTEKKDTDPKIRWAYAHDVFVYQIGDGVDVCKMMMMVMMIRRKGHAPRFVSLSMRRPCSSFEGGQRLEPWVVIDCEGL